MSEIKTFKDLEINETFIAKLEQNQITVPTGVQKQAIPLIQQNQNLLFQSETGTGKTLAYALPLLNKIQKIQTIQNEKKEILILVAAPTFELASQIKNQFKMVSDIKTALLIGGAPIKRQIETLKEKPAVVIGSPARLVELIHLKKIKLEGLQAIVLDEVDRLLSPELRDYTEELINCPKKDVQLIACSATISAATQKVLNNAKIKSDGTKTAEIQTLFLPPEDVLKKRITHIAIFAERRDKIDTLRKLLAAENPSKALVFTSKLDQVQNIVSKLKYKNIECMFLHAKMDKQERKSAIDKFRSGKCKILVTSDLTSRGLDIPDISHVIQMDMPSNDDFFIHRAGRTARAGKTGINIVIGDEYEMQKYANLEKKLGLTVYPRILYKGKLVAPLQDE